MTAILIKDVPEDVHGWLKREARNNRRSMARQAIVLFEERMKQNNAIHWPSPAKTRKPLTSAIIQQSRKEGRA